ncbi:MAG: hypothetical protein ACLP29_04355 [Dissulfurispiraceae bacterium]
MSKKPTPKLRDLQNIVNELPDLGLDAAKFMKDVEKFKKSRAKGDVITILSERTKEVINMEVEFEPWAYALLYQHAKDNMPKQVLRDLMVNWAVADALNKYIEKEAAKDVVIRKKPAKGKGSKAAAKRKPVKIKKT